MIKTQRHLDSYKERIYRQFREEFGIHFQADELQFAEQFLSDVVDEVICKVKGKAN